MYLPTSARDMPFLRSIKRFGDFQEVVISLTSTFRHRLCFEHLKPGSFVYASDQAHSRCEIPKRATGRIPVCRISRAAIPMAHAGRHCPGQSTQAEPESKHPGEKALADHKAVIREVEEATAKAIRSPLKRAA